MPAAVMPPPATTPALASPAVSAPPVASPAVAAPAERVTGASVEANGKPQGGPASPAAPAPAVTWPGAPEAARSAVTQAPPSNEAPAGQVRPPRTGITVPELFSPRPPEALVATPIEPAPPAVPDDVEQAPAGLAVREPVERATGVHASPAAAAGTTEIRQGDHLRLRPPGATAPDATSDSEPTNRRRASGAQIVESVEATRPPPLSSAGAAPPAAVTAPLPTLPVEDPTAEALLPISQDPPDVPRRLCASGDCARGVVIAYRVGENGLVNTARVLMGGNAALNRVLVETVLRWRFAPLTRGPREAQVLLSLGEP